MCAEKTNASKMEHVSFARPVANARPAMTRAGPIQRVRPFHVQKVREGQILPNAVCVTFSVAGEEISRRRDSVLATLDNALGSHIETVE